MNKSELKLLIKIILIYVIIIFSNYIFIIKKKNMNENSHLENVIHAHLI